MRRYWDTIVGAWDVVTKSPDEVLARQVQRALRSYDREYRQVAAIGVSGSGPPVGQASQEADEHPRTEADGPGGSSTGL